MLKFVRFEFESGEDSLIPAGVMSLGRCDSNGKRPVRAYTSFKLEDLSKREAEWWNESIVPAMHRDVVVTWDDFDE